MSADILPLLIELTNAGQLYAQTARGQNSEARVQQVLAGAVGNALTTEVDLARLIKSDVFFSTLTTRRFIRLPDRVSGQLTISPMAFLDGDLSATHPYLRVQLIIVTHTSQTHGAPQCLIMRFETPETNGNPAGEGEHDYYHSQLCTELRIDRSTSTFKVPQCLTWNATSCPAWPVDASTPLQLLACVVLSIYGKLEGMRVLRKAYGREADNIVHDMHLIPPLRAAKISAPRKKLNKKVSPRR